MYLQNCPHSLKLKFHYRLHKTSPMAPNLSQINPVKTFPYYLFNIQFNIILSYTSWIPSLWFPHLNSKRTSPKLMFLLSFEYPSHIWRGIQNMKLLTVQHCPASVYFLLSSVQILSQHSVLHLPQSMTFTHILYTGYCSYHTSY